MTSFSAPVQSVLQDFCASLDLPFRLSADGSLSFRFERKGLLTFTPEPDGEGVMMSLARADGPRTASGRLRLLAAAGHDAGANRIIHCGLDDAGSVHVALHLGTADASLPQIDHFLTRLEDVQNQIFA